MSWSGGSTTGYWSDSANWGYVGVPVNGDTLIFSGGQPRLTNTNNIGSLVLNEIRFAGPSGGYAIYGNGFTVTNSIRATNTAGANTIYNAITFATTNVQINVGAAGLSLPGYLSGTVGVIKNGTGTLTYSYTGANTYSGTTRVNAGLLALNTGGGAAFAGPLIVGDGVNAAVVRHLQSFQIPSQPVTVNTNGILDLNGLNDTIGTSLTFNAGTVQSGAGTLTLGSGNTITVTDYATLSGNLYIGSTTCTFQGTGQLNLSANMSGSAAITKNETMMLYLMGNNTFTGTLTANGGGWVGIISPTGLGATNGGTIINDPAFFAISGSITVTNEALTLNSQVAGIYGAIYVFGGNNTWLGNVTLSSDAIINTYSSYSIDLGGPVSGSGSLTKTGTGTLTLSGSDMNTYAGDTIVNAGLLALNKTGTVALRYGAVIIGDGVGGDHADIVRETGSVGQIYVSIPITVNSSGLLDLNGVTDDVGQITLVGGDIVTGGATLRANEGIRAAAASRTAHISATSISTPRGCTPSWPRQDR